jgi:hypothetical protein
MFILTETQRRHWTAHGWLLLSQGLAPEAVLALSSWVEEMAVEGGASGSAAALLRAHHAGNIAVPSGALFGRSYPTPIADC